MRLFYITVRPVKWPKFPPIKMVRAHVITALSRSQALRIYIAAYGSIDKKLEVVEIPLATPTLIMTRALEFKRWVVIKGLIRKANNKREA